LFTGVHHGEKDVRAFRYPGVEDAPAILNWTELAGDEEQHDNGVGLDHFFEGVFGHF
jgi:hypothetical protein